MFATGLLEWRSPFRRPPYIHIFHFTLSFLIVFGYEKFPLNKSEQATATTAADGAGAVAVDDFISVCRCKEKKELRQARTMQEAI